MYRASEASVAFMLRASERRTESSSSGGGGGRRRTERASELRASVASGAEAVGRSTARYASVVSSALRSFPEGEAAKREEVTIIYTRVYITRARVTRTCVYACTRTRAARDLFLVINSD